MLLWWRQLPFTLRFIFILYTKCYQENNILIFIKKLSRIQSSFGLKAVSNISSLIGYLTFQELTLLDETNGIRDFETPDIPRTERGTKKTDTIKSGQIERSRSFLLFAYVKIPT